MFAFLPPAPVAALVARPPRRLRRPAARPRPRPHPHACAPAPGASDGAGSPTDPRDWREFRAALVAGSVANHEAAKERAYRPGHWAHALSLPEQGCFLASHPAYYRRHAPYLTQAVVFLLEYAPDAGAVGLVLNRPLAGCARELVADGMFGRSNAALVESPFATQPVYLGGPHGLPSGVFAVLHGDPALPGAEPLDGVRVSDLSAFLARRDELGRTDPADCHASRLFAGCVRWEPGMLEAEVDEGSWYCVSASERFALEHCIQLPKPLWVEIMQSQGQPFARIADQVYSDEDGHKI